MQYCTHILHSLEIQRLTLCKFHIHDISDIFIRAETNTRFVRIFARLHSYSNTEKVFEYTANDIGAVILAYLVHI